MNVNDVIKKIKVMMGAQEIQFASATLIDGTEVYTEGELQEGAILFVRSGDGESEDAFAPTAMHELADGRIVTVGENGEITKIEDAAAEAPAEEVALEEEVAVEVEVAPEATAATEELLQGIADIIAPFTEEIAALQQEVVALTKRFEKMAAEPAAPKVTNTFAEILADKKSKEDAKLAHLRALRNN